MRARALLFVVGLVGGLTMTPPAGAVSDCAYHPPERQMSDDGILSTEDLGLAAGRYALPTTHTPTQLVVMFHGHTNDSCSWRNHLRSVAARGAVGVAMDYTGQDPETRRGWDVLAGAEDSIDAARWFLAHYPSISEVFAFGTSMGGNASGLAVAHPEARRSDGRPLFDHWIATEGVHNFVEEYLIARGAAASGNAGAASATEDMESSMGGPLESVPEAYLHHTNVLRASEMAGLRSAILVHGIDDGTVPYDQSRQMATALRAVGVRTELYSVAGRGDRASGTTLTGVVLGPVLTGAGLGPWVGPFAGHGWEGSDSHLVIRIGLEQLFALMDGRTVALYREVLVHGDGLAVPVG